MQNTKRNYANEAQLLFKFQTQKFQIPETK